MKTVIANGKRLHIEWTLSDRVATWINPSLGAQRMHDRALLALYGGYDGGKRDKRFGRNWVAKQKSANEQISLDLPELRGRSRDLSRNNPIATGAINTSVTNVIGDGLVVQPNIDREVLNLTPEAATEWQKQAKREFELWAKNPDFTGRLNFDEMQQVVFRGVLEGGDMFVARRKKKGIRDTYSLKLLLIEAERVSNPMNGADSVDMVSGVALDGGVPVGYSISTHYPDDSTSGVKREWKTYGLGMTLTGQPLILHLYRQLRPDQARGIPFLAPVIQAIKQLGQYQEAEITAAVLAAMFTVFVKKSATFSDGDESSILGDDPATSNVDGDKETQLGPGAIIDLDEGEDIVTADMKRPNAQFGAFIDSIIILIGTALGIPKELLKMEFGSSYSASRASLEIAWQTFNESRTWFIWKFLQPIYEWVITEAVINGRLQCPGFITDPIIREAWLGTRWISSTSKISLDPYKEAQAWEKHLQMKTTTRKTIAIEYDGSDWGQLIEQYAEEESKMKELGVESAPPANTPFGNNPPEGEDDSEDEPKKEGEDGERKPPDQE